MTATPTRGAPGPRVKGGSPDAGVPDRGPSVGAVLRERSDLVLGPVVLVLVLLAWHLSTSVFELLPSIILPAPGAVLFAFIELVTSDWFPGHLYATTFQAITGFLIAAVVATALAVLMDQLLLVRRIVYPYIIVFQVMPAIVLAPVFIIWFGFGMQSKVVVAAATAFFVIVVNTLAGLASVPENSRLLMASLVASRSQVFFKLTMPTALPFVFAAFKTAVTLALIGSLVGEFITARAGLGRLMTQFSFALRQDMMFATIVTVGILGVSLYGIVTLLEKKIVWWR